MKKELFIGLFFNVLILIGKPAFAQNFDISFEHLTGNEGLPNSTILDILQDKKGFLWFAARNGLFRFDGYNFTSFKPDVNNDHSLSDTWISSLYEDSKGVLYVGTWDKGLNIYNNKKENFTRYTANKSLNSIASDRIRCIKEDSQGIIWIGTADNGFFSYNKMQKKFTSYSLPSNCVNNCIYMVVDKDDNLWMTTSILELVQFNTKTKEFNAIDKSFSSTQKSDEIQSKMLLDKKGKLWIGTNLSGLYYYDHKNKITKHWINDLNNRKSLNSNSITDILETNNGQIWIATDGGGIDILDTENGEFYHNTNNINKSGSLSTNAIYCLFSDKNGAIWAGTYLGGINFFNPDRKKFANYKPNSDEQASVASNSILDIFQDKDDDLLIRSDGGGMYLYNKEKYGDKFIAFKPGGNNDKKACPAVVKNICQTKDGRIWIGTWNSGLVEFDKKNSQFSYLGWDKGNPEKISGPIVWSIMEDDNNLLWLGVWPFGVDVYDWKSNKVVKQIRQSNGFKGIYPSQIFKDSKGRIWITTYEAGLNRYIAKSDRFVNYQYNSKIPGSLSSNQVSCIFEDSKGNIWIGTLSGGLNKYNENTDDFTVINENYGLISNEIAGILEDKNGNFWISSYKGIFKFLPSTYKTRNYDTNDGLQGNEFNDCATFKAKDGKFYFGGTKGFNAFYPEQIKDNSYHTPLYITSFSIFNKLITMNSPDSILNQSIIETKEITLPYHKSVFNFEYTALNFNSSKKNQYAYRMENFESEWNYVGNKRYATYTNLDPGEYIFMVKATNNDGVWNDNPTTIKIIITPPYWKTWWFRISAILFVIGSIVSIFIWRTRQLKMQKKLLEIKVRERTNDLEDANTKLEERQEEIIQQSEELKATLNQLSHTQNQLIQSEKMASLGILSAGIAHEINNPLNFINGGIIGLESYFNENLVEHYGNVAMLIEAIQTGVNRAAAIVTSLNHYSQYDDLPHVICDVHSIIDNCLILIQSQITNKVSISKNYTDKPHPILGNESKLHQAFLNIISNAEQSIENMGIIKIETKIVNNKLLITINDSGCGISEVDLQKIFDPFFTTKDPGKGTGLGLSIAYKIIQEHRGTIEYESQIGKGTKVSIQFPLN